jgi:RNA polymerase sigma-70 factor (ECF subfamily)
VDEVMQAVAVAAIEQRSPLADADKAAAWLYRLAVWQTLLYRRRVGRQRKLVRQFGAGAAGDDSAGRSDPLSWLLSDERRQFVQLALERLSRKDAEILLLKYTEDWSYRELAAHLGISEKAVDARLHRARARLRDELAACNLTGESK